MVAGPASRCWAFFGSRGISFTIANGSKTKLKKLRLFLVFAGISALALVSTIFGMMMSVSSDLPLLENYAQLRIARNSILYSASGKEVQLAKLTGTAQSSLLDSAKLTRSLFAS